MADIIVTKDGEGNVVFADPLDDSGDGDAKLPDQTYYTQQEIIDLLNELGLSVSDDR